MQADQCKMCKGQLEIAQRLASPPGLFRVKPEMNSIVQHTFKRTIADLHPRVALTFAPDAHAVPSYSRQTGLPCASCHYAPPELTPFGRTFKLEGYTFATKAEVSDDKKDHNSALHLLEAFPLSIVFDTSLTAIKSPQPGTQNGNFQFPQDVSLFLAGAWTSHVGSFVQVTYDSQGDHFSWDNTDIRYANHGGKLLGKPITYGITLNNNPGVEDLWNSTPAWGYPFVGSNSAPGPSAAALINGTLAQDVAGVGGYAMWNERWYLVGTMYRSEHIGGTQPNAGANAGATFGFNFGVSRHTGARPGKLPPRTITWKSEATACT